MFIIYFSYVFFVESDQREQKNLLANGAKIQDIGTKIFLKQGFFPNMLHRIKGFLPSFKYY